MDGETMLMVSRVMLGLLGVVLVALAAVAIWGEVMLRKIDARRKRGNA